MLRSLARTVAGPRGAAAVAVVAALALLPAATPGAASTAAAASTVVVWKFFNAKSGHVMAVKGASPRSGAAVVQWGYEENGVHNDVIGVEIAPGTHRRLKPMHTFDLDGNPHDDMCLAVKGGATTVNAEIVSATCTYDTNNNDVWTLSEGRPQVIKNLKSGLCLVVKGAAMNAGAILIQHDCNGTLNGKWYTGPAPLTTGAATR